jgi:hypothetical protein
MVVTALSGRIVLIKLISDIVVQRLLERIAEVQENCADAVHL